MGILLFRSFAAFFTGRPKKSVPSISWGFIDIIYSPLHPLLENQKISPGTSAILEMAKNPDAHLLLQNASAVNVSLRIFKCYNNIA
jgi:hypothetical protein